MVKIFEFVDIYSDSNNTLFLGKTKRALDQKSVPNPIIISLAIYPTKILPKAKIIKGKAIIKGAS